MKNNRQWAKQLILIVTKIKKPFNPPKWIKTADLKITPSVIFGIARVWKVKRLVQAIQERQLTESLEVLQGLGIEGELALFVLASIQRAWRVGA